VSGLVWNDADQNEEVTDADGDTFHIYQAPTADLLVDNWDTDDVNHPFGESGIQGVPINVYRMDVPLSTLDPAWDQPPNIPAINCTYKTDGELVFDEDEPCTWLIVASAVGMPGSGMLSIVDSSGNMHYLPYSDIIPIDLNQLAYNDHDLPDYNQCPQYYCTSANCSTWDACTDYLGGDGESYCYYESGDEGYCRYNWTGMNAGSADDNPIWGPDRTNTDHNGTLRQAFAIKYVGPLTFRIDGEDNDFEWFTSLHHADDANKGHFWTFSNVRSGFTDSYGFFSISGVPTAIDGYWAAWMVEEVDLSGWSSTAAVGYGGYKGLYAPDNSMSCSGDWWPGAPEWRRTCTYMAFGDYADGGTISGIVYNDYDADGVFDNNEIGLSGAQIGLQQPDIYPPRISLVDDINWLDDTEDIVLFSGESIPAEGMILVDAELIYYTQASGGVYATLPAGTYYRAQGGTTAAYHSQPNDGFHLSYFDAYDNPDDITASPEHAMLLADITDAGLSFDVVGMDGSDIDNWPDNGLLKIDDELMYFTSRTDNTVQVLRGSYSTTSAAHDQDTVIILYDYLHPTDYYGSYAFNLDPTKYDDDRWKLVEADPPNATNLLSFTSTTSDTMPDPYYLDNQYYTVTAESAIVAQNFGDRHQITINGQVINDESGEPINGVTVTLSIESNVWSDEVTPETDLIIASTEGFPPSGTAYLDGDQFEYGSTTSFSFQNVTGIDEVHSFPWLVTATVATASTGTMQTSYGTSIEGAYAFTVTALEYNAYNLFEANLAGWESTADQDSTYYVESTGLWEPSNNGPDWIDVSNESSVNNFYDRPPVGTIYGCKYDDNGQLGGVPANGVREPGEPGLGGVVFNIGTSEEASEPAPVNPQIIATVDGVTDPWGSELLDNNLYVAESTTNAARLAIIDKATDTDKAAPDDESSLPDGGDNFGYLPINVESYNDRIYTTLSGNNTFWELTLPDGDRITASGNDHPRGSVILDRTGQDYLFTAQSDIAGNHQITRTNLPLPAAPTPVTQVSYPSIFNYRTESGLETEGSSVGPFWLALDETNQRIFMTFGDDATGSVDIGYIDISGTLITIPTTTNGVAFDVDGNPTNRAGELREIAINNTTGQVYAVDTDNNGIWTFNLTSIPSVLDRSNPAQFVSLHDTLGTAVNGLWGIAVDEGWNRVVVTENPGNKIHILRGSSLSTEYSFCNGGAGCWDDTHGDQYTGTTPRSITIDPDTHKIYISDYGADQVTIIAWGLGGPSNNSGNPYICEDGSLGYFEFEDVPEGNYQVCEDLSASDELANAENYEATTPPCIDVAIFAGNQSGPHLFGNWVPTELAGNVFEDTDKDGVKDEGEIGIGGVTVELDDLQDIYLGTHGLVQNNTTPIPLTTLKGDHDDTTTTIVLNSNTGDPYYPYFPREGTVRIDDEFITYTDATYDYATNFEITLLNATRGAYDTTAVAHTSGVDVEFVSYVSADLNGAISDSDTYIPLTTTTGFPDSGTVLIGNEFIHYGALDTVDDELEQVQRGVYAGQATIYDRHENASTSGQFDQIGTYYYKVAPLYEDSPGGSTSIEGPASPSLSVALTEIDNTVSIAWYEIPESTGYNIYRCGETFGFDCTTNGQYGLINSVSSPNIATYVDTGDTASGIVAPQNYQIALTPTLAQEHWDDTAVYLIPTSTVTTNTNGDYSFQRIPIGNYVINEANLWGWTSTGDIDSLPPSAGDTSPHTFIDFTNGLDTIQYQDSSLNDLVITAPDLPLISGLNFGDILGPGTIMGYVWDDQNGNGVVDLGEPYLAGATVQMLWEDTEEPTGAAPVTTGADGKFTFTGVTPGDYILFETDPAGYLSTHPANNRIHIHVEAGEVNTVNYFGDWIPPEGIISGVVFDDNGSGVGGYAQDGVRNGDEPGISDVTIDSIGSINSGLDYTFNGAIPDQHPTDLATNETDQELYVVSDPTSGNDQLYVFDLTNFTLKDIVDLGADDIDPNDIAIYRVDATFTYIYINDAVANEIHLVTRELVLGDPVFTLVLGALAINQPFNSITIATNNTIYLLCGTEDASNVLRCYKIDPADGTLGANDGATITDYDEATNIAFDPLSDVLFVTSTAGAYADRIALVTISNFNSPTIGDDAVSDTVSSAAFSDIALTNNGTTTTYIYASDQSCHTGLCGYASFTYNGTTLVGPSEHYLYPDTTGFDRIEVVDESSSHNQKRLFLAQSEGDIYEFNAQNNTFVTTIATGQGAGDEITDLLYYRDGIHDYGDQRLYLLNDFSSSADTLAHFSFTQVTSNAAGAYAFTNILPGNYQIYEDHSAANLHGFVSSTPDLISVALLSGETSPNHNFGDWEAGWIDGWVCEDSDYDGDCSDEDPSAGIPLVTIDLHYAATGIVATSTTTLDDGSWIFTGLEPGTYYVEEQDPANHESSGDTDGNVPASGSNGNNRIDYQEPAGTNPITVDVGDSVSGLFFADFEIPATTPTIIYGTVYDDNDNDGVFDEGSEAGIGSVQVYLDGAPITTTNINGFYVITGLTVGVILPPAPIHSKM
jgi:protocatechuate 3,4-dioxygenase beta subunit